MKIMRLLLLGVLMGMGMVAMAQKVDGIIVKTGDNVQQFAISDIKEIAFNDGGITVIKADDVRVEFSSDWLITFGEVENSGLSDIFVSTPDAMAHIYNAEGKFIKEIPMSELSVNEFQKGVYIIICNGKSLKIIR